MSTIKEIAQRAKVSIGTVDRVIHNRGKVKPEVEGRIRQILKEMNYTTNVFARNLVLGKIFNFGVLLPMENQDSGYWNKSAEGIKRAEIDLKSQRIHIKIYHYNKYSERSFTKAAEKSKQDNLDGLLIVLGLDKPFHDFVKSLNGLPYVIFGTAITDVHCISCIGQDAFQSGKMAGKLLELLIEKKGTIAVLRILPIDDHIENRAKGIESYFEKKAHINLARYSIEGNSDILQFKRLFKKMLQQNNELKGIFVTNVNTHKIAAQIEEMNYEGIIHLVGYDLVEENIHYLRENVIDFLISQRPEVQAYQGIYALYRHVVLKESVKERVLMQIDIVAKENIDYYQDYREAL